MPARNVIGKRSDRICESRHYQSTCSSCCGYDTGISNHVVTLVTCHLYGDFWKMEVQHFTLQTITLSSCSSGTLCCSSSFPALSWHWIWHCHCLPCCKRHYRHIKILIEQPASRCVCGNQIGIAFQTTLQQDVDSVIIVSSILHFLLSRLPYCFWIQSGYVKNLIWAGSLNTAWAQNS